jgi:hypothetical protein
MPNQTKKLVYSSAEKLYYVIQKDTAPYKAVAEDQDVKKIVTDAETKLKQVFDQSGPSLTSGVKLAITELF